MNNFIKKRVKYLTILLLVQMLWTDQSNSQSLTWLGNLSGSASVAYDVSDDGKAVVGSGFRWTDSTGMQSIAGLAFGVSGEGTIVVGEASLNGFTRAFRWTDSTGLADLGTLGGSSSHSRDVSADGSVIVGYSQNGNFQFNAFRWLNGSMQNLGTLGGSRSTAQGISADGKVIVGESLNPSNQTRAFRTDSSNLALIDLGTLGGNSSVAQSINSDGSVIVGYSENNDGKYRAFRWKSFGGMQELGTIGGEWSQAYDVSDNGQKIVGLAPNSGGQLRAIIWMDSTMQDLNGIYSNLLSNGSTLERANAISSDGRFIVGSGYNATTGLTEAFLLDTDFSTSIENNPSEILPKEFFLQQNYPNPFNPSTTIKYNIPNVNLSGVEGTRVQLKVYDVLGNEIATLVNEEKPAGSYEVNFNTINLSSGMYLYKLQAGTLVETKKMLLLK
jgi:probable HAF family extracellular repeat protein